MIGLHRWFDPTMVRSVLLGVVWIMGLSLGVLVAALVVQKLSVEVSGSRFLRMKMDYRAILEALGEGREVRLPDARSAAAARALAEAFGEWVTTATDMRRERAQAAVRGLRLVARCRRAARTGGWGQRYRAVDLLGAFRLPEFKDWFFSVAEDETNERVFSRALLAASLLVEGLPDLECIVQLLAARVEQGALSSKFIEQVFGSAIRACRVCQREQRLVEFVERGLSDPTRPRILYRDFIEACGRNGLSMARRAIAACYRHGHTDPLMRIACIRAMGSLGGYDPMMAGGLEDPDWRVRAVAACYAGADDPDAIAALRRAMRDAHYQVRINAAGTLGRLGAQGTEALRVEADGPDRFARDLARYHLSWGRHA